MYECYILRIMYFTVCKRYLNKKVNKNGDI